MNLNQFQILKDYFTHQTQSSNDVDDPLISSLIGLINQDQLNEEHELLLLIRKILWNEEDIKEIEDISPILIGLLMFWKHNYIDIVDLKVLINKLQISNRLNDQVQILITDLLISAKKSIALDSWVELIQLKFEDLGNYLPPLSEVLSVYELVYNRKVDNYKSYASLVNSIHNRPEYFNELIENTTSKDLLKILPWVNWKNKRLLTDHLINKELESIEGEDFDNELSIKSSSPDSILYQLPKSYSVLGQKITNYPPQTLDSNDFENVPPKFISEWAPKFVYSTPQIAQKIKIYFPGGKDIGHSAIIVKTNEGMILLDFGLSVVNNTFSKWSHLLEKVDVVLLSHAHLDHSGGLPLLYHNNRKLPWFAKKETKIMAEMLWKDTSNIVERNVADNIIKSSEFKHISNSSNINNALNNYNEIDLHTPIRVLPKVTVQAYNAAHLYGSVGFELNIDGKRLLYTGDFNLDKMQQSKSRMFPSDIDSIIFDGTYWGRSSGNSETEIGLKQILSNSKRILIPAFSMGRSQEILFQLTQLGADKKWKIYLTGMGGRLVKKLHITVGSSGSGRATGINIVPTVDPEDFGDKCIVICGQGMLQAGTSRNLFESTAADSNTSVVFCGYQAPNTMGYHLLNQHTYLKSKYKQQVYRLKMSGHSSSKTLNNFISTITGTKIMVHSPKEARENIKKSDVKVPSGPIDL